jgi:hypothetical protein
MAEPQLLWVQPDWLADAHAWIRDHVEPTGDLQQGHVRVWSTVIRVPTRDGDVYFKAVSGVHAFEPALTAELERARAGRVPELVAVDLDRRWMLMRDAGTRLRELVSSVDDLHHWEALLPSYADLQIAVAAEAGRLLELGVPDERLEGLAARLLQLLEDHDSLLIGHPEGLTPAEHQRLREAVPDVARMCSELAAYGIPETIQHDDLHDGNVFVRDGQYVFFDWGDACVSHPFHSLTVILRAVAWRLRLEPGGRELVRLRDAYLEPFGGGDLADAADLAYHTGTIARAHAWYRFVSAREPELRGDDAEGVPYGLKRFLAGGPIGSWE